MEITGPDTLSVIDDENAGPIIVVENTEIPISQDTIEMLSEKLS